MTVPPKWRTRRDAIKAAMPPIGLVDRPDEAEGKRVAYHLARHSTVPPEHLGGIPFIMMGSDEARGGGAHYTTSTQEIHVGARYNPEFRALDDPAETTGLLTHEIGHHVDHMLNPEQFKSASRGRQEAVAENYKDSHVDSSLPSEYDRRVHVRDFGTQQYMGRLGGFEDYRSYRAAGKQPGETLTEKELFEGPPNYTHLSQKFVPKIKGRG